MSSISKRLMDGIQADLKTLANECKRKFPHIKQSADTCILKLRIITEKTPLDMLPSLLESSTEIIKPFIAGCDTKVAKIVQLCLNSIQRLTQFTAISQESGAIIINTLWRLMESGIEELKLLQTVLLLVNTNNIIQHESLSKAIVLSLRLHFSKDVTVINTAAATVCQLVNCTFERVSEEDIKFKHQESEPPASPNTLKLIGKHAPTSLRPAAQDAFLLFKDLCELVNASQPYWLNGIVEITRTFCLQLIETAITDFSHVFLNHPEFCFILKEKVCTIVIRLFSSGVKHAGSSNSTNSSTSGATLTSTSSLATGKLGQCTTAGHLGHLDRNFAITVRLLRIVSVLILNYYEMLITECEIFLSLLVKFLDLERPLWQRTLVLEVVSKLCSHPSVLRRFCESYDMKEQSTAIFKDIINGLSDFIQSQFMKSSAATTSSSPTSSQTTSNAHSNATFRFHNCNIPLVINITLPMGSHKSVFLEMCDKTEIPSIAEGYAFSLSFLSLLNIVHCIVSLVTEQQCKAVADVTSSDTSTSSQNHSKVLTEQLIVSSWCALMSALSLLLEASTDDLTTDAILNSIQSFTGVCGLVNMQTPRDAFISILCKSSLPAHYSLIANGGQNVADANETQTQNGIQVVAVGTALPSIPGSQVNQTSVMLTSKNIQCMKALLTLSINHGAILGDSWSQILLALQHLSWILGIKTSISTLSSSHTLQSSQCDSSTLSSSVVTTAALTDLSSISCMMTKLFENSKHLDEKSLHCLILSLIHLSEETMVLANTNRDISLFAINRLVELTMVNLFRVKIYWSQITDHLLAICLHQHQELRTCAATSVTTSVKSALSHKYDTLLKDNEDLQLMILSPLELLSKSSYIDIRPQLLECIFQILHANSETLRFGWPLLLDAIGQISNEQSEAMIRNAFQSLQLVVTDFLGIMPSKCLFSLVSVSGGFGRQSRELNISLTSIGLLWNICDYFSQNFETISKSLNPDLNIDQLWMSVFISLGELCVDYRPAVRKSAGQTLFNMIITHGTLLKPNTWPGILSEVLFPLLDNVERLSREASDSRSLGTTNDSAGLLIHHSRDNPRKQWAETLVLTLAGVARVFYCRRQDIISLDNFANAWNKLLEFIELMALSKNSEVSLSALKSFQEILSPSGTAEKSLTQVDKSYNVKVNMPTDLEAGDIKASPTATTSQPSSSIACNSPTSSSLSPQPSPLSSPLVAPLSAPLSAPLGPPLAPPPGTAVSSIRISNDPGREVTLWSAAWNVWLHIGTTITRTPTCNDQFIPSQPYLTAMMSIFPSMYYQVKMRFNQNDLERLSVVLLRSLCVPVTTEHCSYAMPSTGDSQLTQLQSSILIALKVIHQEVVIAAPHIQTMYTDVFNMLLAYVKYSVTPPKKEYHNETSLQSNPKVTWVSINYVPFAEAVILMTVDLYKKTANHRAVIKGHVLENIVKEFTLPLKTKYLCPSQSTWLLVIQSLMSCLQIGLPISRLNEKDFVGLWPVLGDTIEDYVFNSSKPPNNLTNEECERDEKMDLQFVMLIKEQLLPYSIHLDPQFIIRLVEILNKGSIHSTSGIQRFIDVESSRYLRESFSRSCFETLLEFSFIMSPSAVKHQNGVITKLAITSFVTRCHQVIQTFISDEKLSAECPLPRPRFTEMIFVLKAVDILIQTLKKAPKHNVDKSMWSQVISLYPLLVNCISTSSNGIIKPLNILLHQYYDLIQPPLTSTSPTT